MNKVNLRRAQLQMGFLATFGSIPFQYFPCPWCNESWRWFWLLLGKKQRVLCSSVLRYQRTAGIMAYCILTIPGNPRQLEDQGDNLTHDGPTCKSSS